MSRMNAMWAGRTFQCERTGEKLTIPWTVDEGDFFSFGDSFIDVGRDGHYSRSGGKPLELLDERDDSLAFIPFWATDRCFGEYVLGAQLATRDGRRLGNGHIVDTYEVTDGIIYEVLTDAGNRVKMGAKELDKAYFPPVWVSDVKEVEAKFDKGYEDEF